MFGHRLDLFISWPDFESRRSTVCQRPWTLLQVESIIDVLPEFAIAKIVDLVFLGGSVSGG